MHVAKDVCFLSRNDAFTRGSRIRYAEAYLEKENTTEVLDSTRADRTIWVQGDSESIALPVVTLPITNGWSVSRMHGLSRISHGRGVLGAFDISDN